MPSCSTTKNPRGISITFDEASHRYSSILNGKELDYQSVTRLIGQYFPVFDPTGKITEKCALKEGITVEEIKKRWAAKGQESCRLGTRMHEVCEDIELGRELRNSPENVVEEKRFKNAIMMAKAFRQKLDILGVEKLIFDERLIIAGTIDLFGKSKATGRYVIIDHKSNESIETENKYNKFCLDPISHLADINSVHYALQLNLYAYLLKFGGYVEENAQFDLFLNHVTPEKATLIPLANYESEIKDIIIDHLIKIRA